MFPAKAAPKYSCHRNVTISLVPSYRYCKSILLHPQERVQRLRNLVTESFSHRNMVSEQLEGHVPIVDHIDNCLRSFQKAADSLIAADMRTRDKLPSGGLTDELGRFRIWSGNIGGQRRGRNSLDYRLCDASHLRDRLLELLQSLNIALVHVTEILNGERIPWEDMSGSDTDSDSDVDHLEGMHDGALKSTTELSQLSSNIAEINTCLLSMSSAIRNPAPHDQFKQSTATSLEFYEAFDITHVQEKFPTAAQYLVTRLGKALSRRRQYFRYREEHHQNMERETSSQLQTGSSELTSPKPNLAETVSIASALTTITVHAADEKIEADVELESGFEAASQTSNTEFVVASLRIPPVPKQSLQSELFECPYCFRLISSSDRTSWRRHVYRDLQPYVSFRDKHT